MPSSITAMIHVPDVSATVRWYQSIGFSITGTNEDEGDLNWARVAYGDGEVMFSSAGRPSGAPRREVDLYIDADDVDALYEQIKSRAVVVEEPHDTFYGMREFIVRDVNGFWLTFARQIEQSTQDD